MIPGLLILALTAWFYIRHHRRAAQARRNAARYRRRHREYVNLA